ncbi:helix-turn-helix transcriptional regulator [Thermopolyspora sp. NPDC052614]|uniref:helix-turn-helix domain-containing protein n=1 Tax=Thermopolyspora sp. NPDC052614 TaxID=3155682 RepID=UPI0034208D00
MTFGRQLRHWRQQRGMSLAALARESYVSKGYLSRVERDLRRPQRRIVELLDAALYADGELFAAWASEHEVPILERTAGGDTTKRRLFIKSAALASGLGLSGEHVRADQREAQVALLRDALIPDSPTSADAREPMVNYSRAIAIARRDFAAARYELLADKLVPLTTAARNASGPENLALAAQVYHLAARTLIKLSATPYAWTAAHLGERAASASGDIGAMLQARRNLVSLLHRVGDYGKARDLVTATAETMRPYLASARPATWGAYAALLSTGAIAAAYVDDRENASDMLNEAGHAANRAPALLCGPGHVATYWIGVSVILGDAGTAIHHADRIAPGQIPTAERRASYYTGMAQAYTMWGKIDQALRALLIAEKIAPAELTRFGTRQTIADLLTRDPKSRLSGLRALAHRAAVIL